MAQINWISSGSSFNGNFTDTVHWSSGNVPDASGEVALFQNGGPAAYQVNVTTAITPQSILMENAACTLDETGTGSITTNSLHVDAGVALLNTANTIGNVFLSGSGTIEFANNRAMGVHNINMDHGGKIIGFANMTLHNEIDMGGSAATVAAATGDTLRLGGPLFVGDSIGVNFGTSFDHGTVVLVGDALITDFHNTHVNIGGGRLASVTGESGAMEQLLNDAASISITSGATLDIGNLSTTMNLHMLTGGGTLRDIGNDGPLVQVESANFSGKLLNVASIEADGSNTFSGNLNGVAFTMGSGQTNLNLSNASGDFTLTAPNAHATVVIDRAAGTYENFQSGNLTIQTGYSFSANTVSFEAGPGTSIIADIHHGANIVRQLTFEGLTSSDGITVSNHAHDIEFTWTAPGQTAPQAIHDAFAHDSWAHHDVTTQPVAHDPWASHDFI